ncbi:MAG TPA: polysaccharide deacetylase family protein [Candidatus Saccharimonadales bacterium]|nr:polysaccharide deacetylase family protein [Candidatus Saccharimonadales bacterium]
MLSLLLCPLRGHTQPAANIADEIVGNFRRIIVLMEDDASIDAAKKERITTIARMLFEQNLEKIAGLQADMVTTPAKLNSFLDQLETSADYHDADKLAFRELLEDLAADLSKNALAKDAPDPLKKRIADDIATLEQIQALYQKELSHVFDRIRTRGMPVRREAWESYLASIKTQYQRNQLLKQYENLLPVEETRGTGKKKRDPNVLDGTELPPKTLLLTFDDGPHPRYTDAILEVLKKYKLQAIFFEVGHNIGTVGADGKVTLGKGAAASERILQSGSALGNHSYTHPLLPKLDAAGYTKEIDNTGKLLKEVLKSDAVLFRPPYGAQNAGILGVVEADKMKSMIWNIDSMDWADPVPNSVAQRVLKEVEQQGRGVILFHDIHRRALDALPGLIEAFQKQGYRFASWNGTGFSVSDARGVETVTLPKTPDASTPYRESWAAVIGIDDYQKWPRLRYAAHDAAGIRDTLIQKYKFKPENVFVLLNEQATRQNILSLLGDKLANADMVKREDRVFVFFAGHGATRKLPSGRDLGYIIPVDADLSSYEGQAISMTNFQDVAESIPAKHLLFVMDSCYSGLALTRGGGLGQSGNYLQEIARRAARQMFTAGGSDEQVADNGPNGHSIFTWILLQGLDGRADLNGDGVITASELAAYVSPTVSSLSHQTPVFGNLAGSEGGDFIFELKHESEFLNADTPQLNDDGIRMNAQMEALRAQNDKLQKELADAQARLDQKAQAGGPVLTPRETSQVLDDQGMRLYKEKKYAEAAAKFNEAAAADPSNAQAVNNAGFAMYKLERYADSVPLFMQALKLDPNRSVAYINLADAYVKLHKVREAKAAYEKYLELAPNSKSAPDVREKLKALNP